MKTYLTFVIVFTLFVVQKAKAQLQVDYSLDRGTKTFTLSLTNSSDKETLSFPCWIHGPAAENILTIKYEEGGKPDQLFCQLFADIKGKGGHYNLKPLAKYSKVIDVSKIQETFTISLNLRTTRRRYNTKKKDAETSPWLRFGNIFIDMQEAFWNANDINKRKDEKEGLSLNIDLGGKEPAIHLDNTSDNTVYVFSTKKEEVVTNLFLNPQSEKEIKMEKVHASSNFSTTLTYRKKASKNSGPETKEAENSEMGYGGMSIHYTASPSYSLSPLPLRF